MAKKTINKRMVRSKKPKTERIDGLSPKDIKKLRAAIRQVWAWSYPKKLCIDRATGPDGFPRCEQCNKRVPKVFADHIQKVGTPLQNGYIKRMFTPSRNLQALCKKCHDAKTREEKRAERLKEPIDDFI